MWGADLQRSHGNDPEPSPSPCFVSHMLLQSPGTKAWVTTKPCFGLSGLQGEHREAGPAVAVLWVLGSKGSPKLHGLLEFGPCGDF